MLTAYTREVDDAAAAVTEVLAQLELDSRRLANAVGFISFHPEFLASNIVEAISKALPFDVVGGTTSCTSVQGALGEMLLTVSVLTSDTVVFRAGMSANITDDACQPARELYARVAPPETGRPALLIAFAPVVENVGGDDLIAAIDAASGGVPLFGALAFTHLTDFSGIETYANGVRSTDAFALVALFGEVEPHFFTTTIPHERGLHEKAVITRSVKNRLQGINGLPPLDYLDSIGLSADDEAGEIALAVTSFPFVLTLKDGTQIVRFARKVSEEGDILFYGDAPEGANVLFSAADADFVVHSTKEMIARAATESGAGNALVFSCASRRWMLGIAMEKEMKEIARCLGARFSYQLTYSGGEICPVKNREGLWVNRFHNFTMITCLF
ncbi:MAG: FIST C-terminal domain-containing protein [Candidatus Accumulibacter sp.]|nr:FIST C-terminal domain-containing protein [Accumulibacter sp.]